MRIVGPYDRRLGPPTEATTYGGTSSAQLVGRHPADPDDEELVRSAVARRDKRDSMQVTGRSGRMLPQDVAGAGVSDGGEVFGSHAPGRGTQALTGLSSWVLSGWVLSGWVLSGWVLDGAYREDEHVGADLARRAATDADVRKAHAVTGAKRRSGRSADHTDQLVAQVLGLIGLEFDDEATATFQRHPHDDPTALFGHLERTVTGARLHGRHVVPLPRTNNNASHSLSNMARAGVQSHPIGPIRTVHRTRPSV
jgi:hypothetical protein